MSATFDSRQPKRVLVVEDDPDLCQMISRLASHGPLALDLRFASTVDEATELLESGDRFDLILADYLLADEQSGLDLLDACGDDVRTGSFAMMSSMPLDVPDLDPCAFLRKPFSADQCREFLAQRLAS